MDRKRAKKQRESNSSGASEPRDSRLSGWKTALFSVLVPLVFFVLLEGLLALLGIEPRAYENDPYVGFSSTAPLFTEHLQPDGRTMLRTAPNKFLLFNPTQFPRTKASNTFRIFCTGGSTTYGRPYTDSTSFCGWLRQFLATLDPSRRWEVVNAGGISYASYRVALLTEELINYEPDLFIVYSGHNEFLEERTYDQLVSTPIAVRGATAWLRKTRIYSAMETAIEHAGSPSQKAGGNGDGLLAEEVKPLLDSAIGPDAYHRNDELRDQILRHYRFNLARAIDIAASVGAKTILVTPASNLRNTSPFKSDHPDTLSRQDSEAVESLLKLVRSRLNENAAGAALELTDQALALDDRFAISWYLRGRALEALGRSAEAETAYRRARDEDIVPLRALTQMDGIVREVAADRAAPLVDFLKIVEDRSPGGIAGASLFLDHVHPTIEGNRLLALALVDELRRLGIARFSAAASAEVVERVTRQVLGSLDRRSHAEAMNNLSKVQAWAGQTEEAYASSLRAVDLAPDEIAILYQAGNVAQLTERYREAIDFYRRVVTMEPAAAVAWSRLAEVQRSAGLPGEAVDSYRQALRVADPENVEFTQMLRQKLEEVSAESYGPGPDGDESD